MINFSEAAETFKSAAAYKKLFPNKEFEQSTVKNLIGHLEGKYRANRFEENEAARIEFSIEDAVKSYASNKSSAIKIFKVFLKFIEDEYCVPVTVNFPKVDISNSFERQMFIAKALQSPGKLISSLEDELWVDKRTIEKDLARLRGRTDDPIQICGRKFIVEEVERQDGRLHFASTVHPFFLTFNLTQVMCMLRGLKLMCDEPALKDYAQLSALSIWQQLSEYAKKRIFFVTETLFSEDSGWYQALESVQDKMFVPELGCGDTEGVGVIMDCMKNEKTFFVEYQIDDDKTEFFCNCRTIPGTYNSDSIDIDCDKSRKTLFFNKVRKSAYHKEDLF